MPGPCRAPHMSKRRAFQPPLLHCFGSFLSVQVLDLVLVVALDCPSKAVPTSFIWGDGTRLKKVMFSF